jgi:serine protease
MACRSAVRHTLTAFLLGVTTVQCSTDVSAPPVISAAAIAGVSGNSQTAAAGAAVVEPLRVHVTDGSGAGVPEVTVTWTVATGGGSLSSAATTTDPTGHASVTWTLGPHAGAQTVTASVSSLTGDPVTFTATATPNATITGTITVGAMSAPLTAQRPSLGGALPARRSTASPLLTKAGAPTRTGLAARRGMPVPEYVADELIISYRASAVGGVAPRNAPPDPAGARAATAAIATRLAPAERTGALRIVGISPVSRSARVRVADPARLDSLAAALRADPGVERGERNALVRGLRAPARRSLRVPSISTDSGYVFQAWSYRMIDAPAAWDITQGSAGVVVAVIDDGIRFDHPELAPNLTADGYDFVADVPANDCAGGTVSASGDGDGYDPDPTLAVPYEIDPVLGCVIGPAHAGGHGLHVAGTIGAVGNNGTGTTGINWTVRIRPIRVVGATGTGTAYDVAQGILYAAGLPADDGAGGVVSAAGAAHVINLSFGTPTNVAVVSDAVSQATAAGSLVIAAAGNDASSASVYPAANDDVLAVAAVGPDGALASYSNFGPTIDIAAPGGDLADGSCDFAVTSTWWHFDTGTPAYECIEGTSMAASHVSGIAALLLSHQPGLTVAQLRARLLDYAADAGAAGRDDSYGAGIANAHNSLTQTLGPVRQLYVRLYDAATGALLSTIAAQPGVPYAFEGLADGAYHVYAGLDADGDQVVGSPGRPWSALGGGASATTIVVDGAGTYAASFAVAAPSEVEPNETPAGAGTLVVGGYVRGATSSETDADVYRVAIPSAGTYTFETSAVAGACGFALEEDTVLELLDATEALVAEHDDVDYFGRNYCSQVSTTLAPGTYYLRVRGKYGERRYHLQARSGT